MGFRAGLEGSLRRSTKKPKSKRKSPPRASSSKPKKGLSIDAIHRLKKKQIEAAYKKELERSGQF